MSERYSRLFMLPVNLYTEGAPVIIAAGALLKDNQSGSVLAQLKLQSISNLQIKAAKVELFPLDTVGNPLGGPVEKEYLDLAVTRNATFGQKTPIVLPNVSTRAYTARVTEVAFQDNSVWKDAGGAWASLPVQKRLTDALTDPELVKQYQLTFGQHSQFAPAGDRDLWLCTCGNINHAAEGCCHACRCECAALQNVDMAAMQNAKQARLAEEAQEAAEAKAKAEKLAAEAAERTKAIRKKLAIAAAIIVPVVIALIVVFATVIVPKQSYNKAMELIEEQKYDEAYALLKELDKDDEIKLNKHDRAMEMIKAEEFDEAYALLEEIGKGEEIVQNKYDRAMALIDDGSFKEGFALLRTIGKTDKIEQIEQEALANAKVGSTVFFGVYEQDKFTSDKETIEWIVLAKKKNKIFVISKYLLDCQSYHANKDEKKATWETCSLRKWLNEDFYNTAFRDAEKGMIMTTTVTADKNPESNADPGNNTEDKIFLLSIDEANEYFSSNVARNCTPTSYSNSKSKSAGSWPNWWWLRSPGNYLLYASFVDQNGVICTDGIYISFSYAIRPAMWISIGD